MKLKTDHLNFLTTARIQTLADSIFSIAMTLLVLSIQLPEQSLIMENSQILKMFLDLIPRFYALILSFILLASFWKIHHRQYHWISRLDNRLMWINMLWFLMVVLVPFSSSLIGKYGSLMAAALFFHANLLLIGFFSLGSWIYAFRFGLIENSLSEKGMRYETALSSILPISAMIAILFCLLSPSWSSMAYFLILPMKLIVRKLILGRMFDKKD